MAEKKVAKSDDEWRRELSSEQFEVLRGKGTERPFTGKYDHFGGEGTFLCAGCGAELFSSRAKFDSGSGWPSFWEPANSDSVTKKRDSSHGMERTEALCSRCDGHLGHIFPDGPDPTGLRYCINSDSLEFAEGEKGD